MKSDHGTWVGYFIINSYRDGKLRKSKTFKNTIMNAGIERLMKIFGGGVTSNITFDYIRLGTNSTTPNDRTLTNVKTPIESKIPLTNPVYGTVFPYELNMTATIAELTITRPKTVKEIGVFFSPHSGGKMFSRVVLDGTGYDFETGEDDSIVYGLYLT